MASSSAGARLNDPLTLVGDFLGAAVHTLLHARGVYPPETFERRRLFEVQVYVSRHQELIEYVASAVRGATQLLAQGAADSLVLRVLGAGAPAPVLERFVFELRAPGGAAPLAELDAAALRAQLRGFLVKLHVCDSLLAPLPGGGGLTFGLELHAQGGGGGGGGGGGEDNVLHRCGELRDGWVECDARDDGGAVQQPAQVVPLKSLAWPQLSVQLLVQEAANKR